MVYLGVKFDTLEMCMHVEDEKIVELKNILTKWSRKTVASKQSLQSILGKLIWVSKTVRFSRVFVARIICAVRVLPSQKSKTTLSYDVRKDLLWWEKFIQVFSGVELIPPVTVSQFVLGDAYPQGGGSWNPVLGQFFSMRFPDYLCTPEIPIHLKEFIVVILCVRTWGMNWAGQRILIYCDNDAVCDTITHQKPKNTDMQKYLREFLYWVCKYNFFPVMQKISSSDNHIADMISRNHDETDIANYFSSNGYVNQIKIDIPPKLYDFVADW